MSDVVVNVENLSKRYVLAHRPREAYSSLRDEIMNGLRSLTKKKESTADNSREDFWALDDVSFQIKKGERIGIIGRNGAGKSTLLKILSRITEPTKGRVTIEGRVASLLEVGTGFHQELTGRENIFLNGAILGMNRAEIKARFDEIVAFAEVEKFLDTPVKRYSSGMYVRLAFAVAAHLEPEILIVDEVLAVGDAQFQKKCLGRMEDVSRNEGRTVLFVSHNMSTLKSLCSSIIYLKNGRLVSQGDVETTIKTYLAEDRERLQSGAIPRDFHRKFKTNQAFFTALNVRNETGEYVNEFYFGETFHIDLELDVLEPLENCLINVLISSTGGEVAALMADADGGVYRPRHFAAGVHRISVQSQSRFLPGRYTVSVFLASYHNGTPIDWVEHVNEFKVSNVGVKKGSDYPWGLVHGYVEAASSWTYPTSAIVETNP